jgi:hypothetical protein
MTNNKTEYLLQVSYPSDFYYLHGYNHPRSWDSKIETTVGRLSDGSGMGFGRRDLDFQFKTKRGALNACKKLAKFSRVRRKVVEIND